MKTIEQIIISLVKSAIDNSVAVVPENSDWKEIFRIGKTHKLTPLIYRGIVNSELSLPENIQNYVDNVLLSYFMTQKEKAFAVMDKLGFKMDKESPHEYIYIKDRVCVELHKCLVPPYNKDLYA